MYSISSNSHGSLVSIPFTTLLAMATRVTLDDIRRIDDVIERRNQLLINIWRSIPNTTTLFFTPLVDLMEMLREFSDSCGLQAVRNDFNSLIKQQSGGLPWLQPIGNVEGNAWSRALAHAAIEMDGFGGAPDGKTQTEVFVSKKETIVRDVLENRNWTPRHEEIWQDAVAYRTGQGGSFGRPL
jgi:hypothetical protein